MRKLSLPLFKDTSTAKRFLDLKTISVDFETPFDTANDYGIKQQGTWNYVHDPRTDPYLISVSDGADTWAGHPRDFNWAALEGNTLLSHNRWFDSLVYRQSVRRGKAPQINYAAWHCTANLTTYLCMRRDLSRAAEFLLGAKPDKSYREDADGRSWEQMEAAGVGEKIKEAGRVDALRCWQFFAKYGHLWPQLERDLSDLSIRQGQRGAKIDRARLDSYTKTAQVMLIQAEADLPWMKEGKKPTSTKAIAEECRRVGIPCPPVKKHDGEEAYDAWAETYGPKHAWVKAYTDYRVLNKFLKTLDTIRERLHQDEFGIDPDIFSYDMLYFGAHCFPGDHEVLTPKGWVRLDEWKGGPIMQWIDGEVKFDDAVANEFDAPEEKLLEAKTGQVSFRVTEGHWLATLKKSGKMVGRQAGEARHVRLQIPLSGRRSGGETLPDWKVRLFVAIQADGHYFSDCRSIRFRLSKPRKIERLRALLESSGLDWSETIYPSEPGVTVIVIRQFPEWLEGRKRWGAEGLTWSFETLNTLVKELEFWDGTRCGPNSVEYTTTDKNNAGWISTFVHLTGRAASISIKTNRERGWSDAYRVFIRESGQTCVQPKDWKVLGSAGKVFCPTAKHGVCLFRNEHHIFVSKQTGRWSGAGGFNMQNMRKDPLYCDTEGRLITDAARLREIASSKKLPDYVAHALDVRALFIARAGRKLIISDLSQIEPRVLAWLVNDTAMLASMAAGQSPYEAHARGTMNWTGGEMKKENKELYALAKARVLGLGYGCGWKKFITVAQVMAGLDITVSDPEFEPMLNVEGEPCFDKDGQPKMQSGYGSNSRRIVKDYRASNPLITGLWKTLDTAFRDSVGGDFTLTLPSGRSLRYPEVKRELKAVADPDHPGKFTRKIVTTALAFDQRRNGVVRMNLYGGLLAENLVQATARDVFGEHLLSLDSTPGIDVLWTVHDEAICEVDNNVTAKDIESIMSKAPAWMPGLPVAAEAQEVECYKK